jgi:hypothetical protein
MNEMHTFVSSLLIAYNPGMLNSTMMVQKKYENIFGHTKVTEKEIGLSLPISLENKILLSKTLQ